MKNSRSVNSFTALWRFRVLFSAFVVFSFLGSESLCSQAGNGRGADIYQSACANCHGANGKGVTQALLGFDLPLPDFTDCEFARREPDADWVIVAHQGGPIRGFSNLMPAFGKALTEEELLLAVRHIRGFCGDQRWPRGELNLPKPLITGKAFPEDEVLFTTGVDGDMERISSRLVYEKRLGARNQLEVAVPFGWNRNPEAAVASGTGAWSANLGDLSLGYKRVLLHDHRSGSIFSVMGELFFPLGDRENEFGKGTWVFEPFFVFSQALSGDYFFHSQAGLELPFNTERAQREAFFRIAVGRSFTTGSFGRTWSPMLGILAARELAAEEPLQLDLVPQIQITLNQRQHIMFNIGVRIPVTQTDERPMTLIAYLLWDWFDGGFFQGW